MTQPDIKLSTEEVRRHAAMVDEAAAMLREATGGAQYVNLHDEVYGELCSPLILPLLNFVQDQAQTEIRNGTDATDHLAGQLRAMADNVDITDSEAACRINGVRR